MSEGTWGDQIQNEWPTPRAITRNNFEEELRGNHLYLVQYLSTNGAGEALTAAWQSSQGLLLGINGNLSHKSLSLTTGF